MKLIFEFNNRGNKMPKSISLKDQTVVDKKIDAYCESSAKLLESIHTRHGNKAEAMSSRRNKAEKKKMAGKINIMSDQDVDSHDEELLDSSYE